MITFGKEFEITFKVKKVFNDQKAKADSAKYEGIGGDTPAAPIIFGRFKNVYEGDVFKAKGEFVDNENGVYVRLNSIPTIIIPSTEIELRKYAASQIKGVSIKTMEKITDAFGEGFISKIATNPEAINDVKISEKQKQDIIDWCVAHADLENTIIQGLSSDYNLTPAEVMKIYNKYGDLSLQIINTKPYELFYSKCLSFRDADRIALRLRATAGRMKAGIVAYLLDKERNGNMAARVSLNDINYYLEDYYEQKEFDEAKSELIATKQICEENGYIMTPENLAIEKSIASFVHRSGAPALDVDAVYQRSQVYMGMIDEQRRAIALCASNRFSILTGGPGTGKTSTLKFLFYVIRYFRPEDKIALMSPTGKAASRMASKIAKTATTIHAAFGLSADDNLAYKDGFILDADWIIVDECSMIDEALFAYMVNHIKPDAHVVLCGDEDQLPSVGAGNLLSELLKMNVPHAELKEIHRQSLRSNIIVNANKIKQGTNEFGFGDDFQFNQCNNNRLVNAVVNVYKNFRATTDASEILILSPVKNETVGVKNINRRIQALNPSRKHLQVGEDIYKVNDRVIQLKNDSSLDIHNGDVGTIVDIIDKTLVVQFDEKEDLVTLKDLKEVSLAYAITVHKSQGSEAKKVIMVFGNDDISRRMLKKKLIYTGITRAKEYFIGLGSREALEKGALDAEEAQRISLISTL